jgi:hypothetical protein
VPRRSLSRAFLRVPSRPYGPRALITQPIDNTRTVTLYGNTRPEVTASHDRGWVADDFALSHMLLQLKRPPEVESALEAYRIPHRQDFSEFPP